VLCSEQGLGCVPSRDCAVFRAGTVLCSEQGLCCAKLQAQFQAIPVASYVLQRDLRGFMSIALVCMYRPCPSLSLQAPAPGLTRLPPSPFPFRPRSRVLPRALASCQLPTACFL